MQVRVLRADLALPLLGDSERDKWQWRPWERTWRMTVVRAPSRSARRRRPAADTGSVEGTLRAGLRRGETSVRPSSESTKAWLKAVGARNTAAFQNRIKASSVHTRCRSVRRTAPKAL